MIKITKSLAILLLFAICPVGCTSFSSSSSFLHVVLPHTEPTIRLYGDFVASTKITILKVSNPDVTIIPYFNASAVWFVVLVELAKVSWKCVTPKIVRSVRSHWKPILSIVISVESGVDFCYLYIILTEVSLHALLWKAFNLLQDASICETFLVNQHE